MTDKKNKITRKKKKNYFEIIFVSISIFLFVLLVFLIVWFKNSLYQAKDQISWEFIKNYDQGLFQGVGDSVSSIKSDKLEESLSEPINDGFDPILGSKETKVKIFYFSDFSCPFCLEQEEIILNVYNKFRGDVSLVWKDYPDLFSENNFSYQAARAARCANEQDRFWDYSKLLYRGEDKFLKLNDRFFIDLAEDLKLNVDKFTQCLLSDQVDNAIINNIIEAEKLDIVGVPFLFVNDKNILGDFSEDYLEDIINLELAK